MNKKNIPVKKLTLLEELMRLGAEVIEVLDIRA
jgi:hypothetical protein